MKTARKKAETREEQQDREFAELGQATMASIHEMVEKLDARDADDEEEPDEDAQEKAREAIQEDALSVEVRSGWTSLGETMTADEFCILLSTGGPASRIVGELRDGEPHRCWLELQDWFTPWREYIGSNVSADRNALLAYARCFYFGGES